MNNKLLEIKDLKVHFHLDEGTVKAVNGVSYDIYEGQTLGVVGESGCGKSVTAQAVMRIVPYPGQILERSQILLHRPSVNGKSEVIDLVSFDNDSPEIRAIRGREIAMIFQEPMTAFSPMYTIGNQISEAVVLHQKISKKEAREKTIDMLNLVGIPKPSRRVDEYSFELSGGLRQRAMIAMALSCQPRFLIADEPTTALDVTVQAQILELLRDLQAKMGMAVQLITHDLGVIAEMAQEVIVMYMGSIVEQADVDSIFHNPQHPYTRALLKSIPRAQSAASRLGFIDGMVPDPFEKIEGCPFYPRCSERDDVRCLKNQKQAPILREIQPGHKVACYLFGDEVSEQNS